MAKKNPKKKKPVIRDGQEYFRTELLFTQDTLDKLEEKRKHAGSRLSLVKYMETVLIRDANE